MGAWDTGPFDNDDAADWVYELEEAVDATIVRAALRSVVESLGYLESPNASVAIAAAEVVAASRGRQVPSLPDSVALWSQAHRGSFDDTDRQMAIDVVDRVLGTDSELTEVWLDSWGTEWTRGVNDLRRRLAAD